MEKPKPEPADVQTKIVWGPDSVTLTFACGTRATFPMAFFEALRLTVLLDAHCGLVDLTKPGWGESYDMADAARRTVAELASPVLH